MIKLRKIPAKTKRYITDGILYLLGSTVYALSVTIFTAPNNIAPGGVTGISTLINYLFGFPIGTMYLLINIPLMIAAWRHLGIGFTVRTSISIALVSVIIDITTPFVMPFRGDMILTVVFGGVLSGAGIGMIFMRGGTTGGSDVVARLLERKLPHIPIGRLILLVDALVVTASAIVYKNAESALYAVILIFVSSTVMDTLIYGSRKGKMLLIITKKEKELKEEVINRLNRGVTMLKAAGGYTSSEKQVLLCAVRPSEVYELRTLIYDLDPEAFIMVVSTDEVLGEGFKQLDKKP